MHITTQQPSAQVQIDFQKLGLYPKVRLSLLNCFDSAAVFPASFFEFRPANYLARLDLKEPQMFQGAGQW